MEAGCGFSTHIHSRIQHSHTLPSAGWAQLSTSSGTSDRASTDSQLAELRPIVDKTIGKLYMGFQSPWRILSWAVEDRGLAFPQKEEVSHDVLKRGIRTQYYGAYGPWTHWDPL
jgi:hypothetical protein